MSDLPIDPWELSAEEVEERLGNTSHPVTRQLLEAMWRSGPQMQLNARALADMPNAGSLYAAIQALTEEELRMVLLNFLYEYHQMRLSPEAFAEWAVPPELEEP